MSTDKKGKVKWFDTTKGFGFIQGEDGKDVFVHYTGIAQQGYRGLKEGQDVTFVLSQGAKGLQATEVNVIEG